MKLIINVPKEAVMTAASFLKLSGEPDYMDMVEESDNISVELTGEAVKEIVGDDYAKGMMGLAGFGLMKEKERRDNERKGN